MTTVFHEWPYGGLTGIQSKFRRKKLHRSNQGSNFLEGSFINRDNLRAQFNLEEKVNPSILKDDFSSRTCPSIFTTIAPVLLDQSNRTSCFCPALKSRSQFMPQSTVSHRSNSRSRPNSSCCHRSGAWLE